LAVDNDAAQIAVRLDGSRSEQNKCVRVAGEKRKIEDLPVRDQCGQLLIVRVDGGRCVARIHVDDSGYARRANRYINGFGESDGNLYAGDLAFCKTLRSNYDVIIAYRQVRYRIGARVAGRGGPY
jgi:hypothetical protein